MAFASGERAMKITGLRAHGISNMRKAVKCDRGPAPHWAVLGAITMVSAFALTTQSCVSIRQALFHRDVSEMIANAKTPADHDAIAAAYDQEAAYNRDEAAVHLEIAESYDRRPRWRFDYSKICRQMARDYADLAKEDDELAQEHRKMAESLRSAGEAKSQGPVIQGAARTTPGGSR